MASTESTTNQTSETTTIDKKIGADGEAFVIQAEGDVDYNFTSTDGGAFDLAEKTALAALELAGGAVEDAQEQSQLVAEMGRSEASDMGKTILKIGLPVAALAVIAAIWKGSK